MALSGDIVVSFLMLTCFMILLNKHHMTLCVSSLMIYCHYVMCQTLQFPIFVIDIICPLLIAPSYLSFACHFPDSFIGCCVMCACFVTSYVAFYMLVLATILCISLFGYVCELL